MRFLQQSPQDPFALQFSIAFTDSDGDLGGGSLHLLISGREAAVRSMGEVFQSQVPPIEPAATEGELEVVARIRDDIPVGERVKIGFVLEDAKGEGSNEPYIVFEAQGG
jgi:hypothetical protein